MRSSPGKVRSSPPLKKKVTCAYFCVLGDAQLGLAALGQVFAHGHLQGLRRIGHQHVGHRRVVLCHADVGQREEAVLARRSRSKSGSTNARVISRARSGRKLKNTTESFGLDRALGIAVTVGSTNRSVRRSPVSSTSHRKPSWPRPRSSARQCPRRRPLRCRPFRRAPTQNRDPSRRDGRISGGNLAARRFPSS